MLWVPYQLFAMDIHLVTCVWNLLLHLQAKQLHHFAVIQLSQLPQQITSALSSAEFHLFTTINIISLAEMNPGLEALKVILTRAQTETQSTEELNWLLFTINTIQSVIPSCPLSGCKLYRVKAITYHCLFLVQLALSQINCQALL